MGYIMGQRTDAILDGASRFCNFLGKRNKEALQEWWDSLYAKRESVEAQLEFEQFVSGMLGLFQVYIRKGQFKELKEIFDILPKIHKNFQKVEMNQLRHALEDKDMRSKHLSIYLKEGKAQTLLSLVDETFGPFATAHPEDGDIQWYWQDIHDQLAGILSGKQVDEY